MPAKPAPTPQMRLLSREDQQFREDLRRDDDDDPAPVAAQDPLYRSLTSSAPMELEQLLALGKSIGRARSAGQVARHAAADQDDVCLLEDEDEGSVPDSTLSDEARLYHKEKLAQDLRVDTHAGRLLVCDLVESLGRAWAYERLLARLLRRPTRRSLDDIRKLELAREVAHRAVTRDLEAMRLLKMPVGGISVQVQAAATEGSQVNVAVGPTLGPIPKRR